MGYGRIFLRALRSNFMMGPVISRERWQSCDVSLGVGSSERAGLQNLPARRDTVSPR